MPSNSQANDMPRSGLGRLASWVITHRRRVLLVWAVLFLFGGYASSQLTSRLSYDFSLPGQPAYETGLKIRHLWGNGGNPPTVLVVTVPQGSHVSADHAQLAAAFAAGQRAAPRVRVADVVNTGDQRFVTSDGRTTYAFLFVPPNTGFGPNRQLAAFQAAATAALPRDHVGITGIEALSSGGSSRGPSVLIETVFAGLGALAVLAFVFASVLALMPLLIAIVSILSTFLVLLGLTYVTPVSFIVQFLVALVGLGVAIDYSLLVVTRWREERARGSSNEEAVVTAMETAGRAVLISGLTVAIGLLSLLVLPVPFLRSVGIGGMLIPLISVAVVLTLLPALLVRVGPRMDWPRIRTEASASKGWTSWTAMVSRHPWRGAVTAIVLLCVAAFPVLHIRVGQTSAQAEAQRGSAHALYAQLQAGGVAAGVITPLEILVESSHAAEVSSRLRSVAGVDTVALPTGTNGTRSGLSDVIVVPTIESVNSATLGPVRSVEHAVAGRAGVLGVAGEGPGQQAFTSAVYGNAPLMLLVLAVLMFLLLARAFRSMILAIKAVVLNIVSLAATFGILTWFWQDGHGSSGVFGIPATGAITFWVPISVFAFLFGLSMDYEVFILSRVREEYDKGRDTNQAVIEGLGRTGRLVTSAALILFLAFVSLASAPNTDIKIMATGLGVGILIDATVIRALLVPSMVVLFGRLNWWLPRPLARALFVRPESLATST
jgi:RND superfamily putative drug exporter